MREEEEEEEEEEAAAAGGLTLDAKSLHVICETLRPLPPHKVQCVCVCV